MCKIYAIFAKNLRFMCPKWIFFDLDDTLFDFSSASLKVLNILWNERAEINSIFPTPEAFIDEYHIHNSRMWELHESGQISADFLKGERFRLTIAPERNDTATRKLSHELNDRYLWLLGECNMVCPGAEELLQFLSRHYLIGVLTNGFTEVQYRKLAATGINRYIQRMVISDEIGIQKPDIRIFRYAEKETGAKSAEIVMIGDNPDNDIKGAIDAGWKAIYYDRKNKEFNSDSSLYIGKTTDLRSIADIDFNC